jgi:hypothetical protein
MIYATSVQRFSAHRRDFEGALGVITAIVFAFAAGLIFSACGSDTDETSKEGGAKTSGSSSSSQATRTPSGLDGTRLLSSLTDDERERFCAATVSTLFSASTPERECELDGIETSVILGEQTVTCAQAKQDCLLSFSDVHTQGCVQDLEQHLDCTASVKDGEECSFATAVLRPSLLPNATCASDLTAKKAAINGRAAAKRLADTPECTRYIKCRSLF